MNRRIKAPPWPAALASRQACSVKLLGLEIFPVTSRVYCLRRRSYLTCSYVIDTGSGIVLVDAGMDSSGSDVVHALDVAFKAEPRDVRAILLTHWHNDHAAGAAAIAARSKAEVYYHEGDRAELTGLTARRGVRGAFARWIPELGPLILFKGLLGEATPNPVAAHRLVEDGEELTGGFEVLATPGHTPGHLSFYFAAEAMLFAGDALAVIGDEVRFMARSVTPDRVAARQSMLRCLERPLEHLCPGHRLPLSNATAARCEEMQKRLLANADWPAFG